MHKLIQVTAAAGLLSAAAMFGVAAPALAANSAQQKTSNVQQGKKLAFTRSKGNCLACHQIKGGDLVGNVGPQLKNMKQRYPNRKLLFKRIWDETQYNPQTLMPPFGRNNILKREEINKIIDFLYTL